MDADLENGKLKVIDTINERIEEVETDLIIGADGAYSTIRRIMMKRPLLTAVKRTSSTVMLNCLYQLIKTTSSQ